MPRVFDNTDLNLDEAPDDALKGAHRTDFSVGYFNPLGWRKPDRVVHEWPGGDGQCRHLLVGMRQLPRDEPRPVPARPRRRRQRQRHGPAPQETTGR
jgi:hypothetical protein